MIVIAIMAKLDYVFKVKKNPNKITTIPPTPKLTLTLTQNSKNPKNNKTKKFADYLIPKPSTKPYTQPHPQSLPSNSSPNLQPH